MGDAGLVRHAVPGELLLGRPHHGDFRDGVDPDREVAAHRLRLDPEHVAGGEASLLARSGGQRGETDDVAGGVDVLR